MTRLVARHLFAMTFAGLLCAACASGPIDDVACPNSLDFRRPVSPERAARDMAEREERAPVVGSYEDIVTRALLAAPRTTDPASTETPRRRIAVLSGGGQYGAYGAGFLKAWRHHGGKDIEFAVVTGISTGALQSTLVFLGEDSDSADLVDAYSIDDEKDLAKKRASLFGIPLKNSIYSLAPARKRIAGYMTPERIERVAKAAKESRKLLVGIVDAREGKFYAFDLTALAASDMDEQVKRRCYIEALMASAAVPLVFPPVYLDGHQYYDGGVRASAFLDSTAITVSRLAARSEIKLDIYLVFNGYLEIGQDSDLKNSILATLMRTKDIAFDQIERFSVQSILRLADRRRNVRWTRIPSRLCLDDKKTAPDEDVFNAPFMACLIDKGTSAGGGPDPWLKP